MKKLLLAILWSQVIFSVAADPAGAGQVTVHNRHDRDWDVGVVFTQSAAEDIRSVIVEPGRTETVVNWYWGVGAINAQELRADPNHLFRRCEYAVTGMVWPG
ncbi:MAG TPA: hypothetical protein PKX61_09890, partial [Syntrophales bacterium]|nr:hypothetical protein [Syntrophales bacterium]